MPVEVSLFVGDIDGPGLGPVSFINSTPSSGLSWSYVSLASLADSIDFSNDNAVTWTYVPVPDADGFDGAITHIRLKPQGQMNAAGATNPYAEFMFRIKIR